MTQPSPATTWIGTGSSIPSSSSQRSVSWWAPSRTDASGPRSSVRERLCHGLVEAQRIAQDPEVILVIAADVDPEQLVVTEAIDRLVAKVHLAIGPVRGGEEGSDAHRPDRMQPACPDRG